MKTVRLKGLVGSNPTSSAISAIEAGSLKPGVKIKTYGEIPKLAEGDGLLNR